MINTLRVGSSVVRYRGGEGQWAWAIHRAAGLGIVAFLSLHIFDIFLAAFGPDVFNQLLFLYKGLFGRIGEILLAFGLLYHAFNGLRIIAADFIPRLARLKTARVIFGLQIILFLAAFIPMSYMMMFSLSEPYGNNPTLALAVTFGILALPVILVLIANFTPASIETRVDLDAGAGNYANAYARILRGRPRRPMNRTERNVWLFMRVAGLLIIVMVAIHFYIMHFFIGVEAIEFDTIVARWQESSWWWFWRGYDLTLLGLAFTHGILGLSHVISDYVHHATWRKILFAGIVLLWLVLMLTGAGIIFFFKGTVA